MVNLPKRYFLVLSCPAHGKLRTICIAALKTLHCSRRSLISPHLALECGVPERH